MSDPSQQRAARAALADAARRLGIDQREFKVVQVLRRRRHPVARQHRQVHTLGGKALRDGPADSLACAGDDSNTSVQPEIHIDPVHPKPGRASPTARPVEQPSGSGLRLWATALGYGSGLRLRASGYGRRAV